MRVRSVTTAIARLSLLAVLWVSAVRLPAAEPVTGIITTFAGNGSTSNSGDGGAATSAGVHDPSATAVDDAGNVYIADTSNSRIRKVNTTTGVITTVAGSFGGFSGDGGPATAARIFSPEGVAVNGAGDIFIADTGNHCIRKVSAATGLIVTFAGTGTSAFGGFAGDGGPATAARLHYPSGVALDSAGNLYIADFSNNRVRKVTAATGVITTLAGTGAYGFGGDGAAATAAQLRFPSSVAVDGAGNVYITDEDNNRVRKVNAVTGLIATVAGGGSEYGEGGTATEAFLDDPRGVAVDGAGNLYIADTGNQRIRKVAATTGLIVTVAGNGENGFGGDGGAATAATLNYPNHVTVDGEGKLYIADTWNNRIRRVTAPATPALLMTTLAGNGENGDIGDGGPATSARLATPSATAVDSAGNVYIADISNDRIRKVNAATGIITTVAGTYGGFFGDGGAATSARISSPRGIAVDGAGNIFIADTHNHRIRKVTVATGLISTVAGSGSYGSGGDGGAATAAQLDDPSGVAVDGTGNLYIADTDNNRVRKVTAATGVITTLAGDGTYGFGGDGAAASAAQMRNPFAVGVNGEGNVYIADRYNNRIRKVATATGVITTVAGGGSDYGEGGMATAARFEDPTGVAVDGMGNFYIADFYAHRIRKVTASTGLIATVAGNGTLGFGGDGGVATAATMNYPIGVAVDAQGSLYIADSENERVRAAFAFVLQPPSTFSAAAMSNSQVQLSWSSIAGAANYEVWRSSDNSSYALTGTFTGTSAIDSGRSANTSYLYKVRARNGAGGSLFTAIDLATTLVFHDATLTGTVIKAVHIQELRTAINAVRAAAGLPATTFTDTTLLSGSTPIRQVHVTSLRAALDPALVALGLTAVNYAQPSITAGSVVRATHLTELRSGTQ